MRYCFLRFPGGKPKAFTMSYDDGVRADIRLAEICNRYGVKCTFNINAGMIHQESGHRRLCADEIREHLLGAGHEIAVHGFMHRAPGILRPIDAMQDVLNDRLGLEKEFGGIIRGMAYPDSGITKIHPGTNYETIRQILQDLGIALIVRAVLILQVADYDSLLISLGLIPLLFGGGKFFSDSARFTKHLSGVFGHIVLYIAVLVAVVVYAVYPVEDMFCPFPRGMKQRRHIGEQDIRSAPCAPPASDAAGTPPELHAFPIFQGTRGLSPSLLLPPFPRTQGRRKGGPPFGRPPLKAESDDG